MLSADEICAKIYWRLENASRDNESNIDFIIELLKVNGKVQ
jgi:hypothetical protein